MFGISNNFVDQCLIRFDKDDQIDILQEECAELIKACSKVKRGMGHFTVVDPLDNLKEELAHVAISSAVVARLLDIKEEDIEKEVNKKAAKYNFKVQKKVYPI